MKRHKYGLQGDKYMKKFLGILLSITLVLGLASCGKTTASVKTESTVDSTVSASVSETESESKSELPPEPGPESESKPASEPDSAPADSPAEGTDTETGSEDSSASVAEESWTFTDMDTFKYAKASVNVRDLPNRSGKKLGSLKQNDRVHITGRCNETGWYRFEYKNGIGYGHGNYFVNEKVNVQANAENNSNNTAGNSQSAPAVTGYPNEDFTDVEPTYSYPDPATMSLLVTPITKNNYTTYVSGNSPAGLNNYKDDTVFGFEVKPTGLDANLNIFDRIDFYVYDAKYYATTMKPLSDTLRSSNPPSGTTLSFISNEGQADDGARTYFYPYNDTHYVAKVSIGLKRTSDSALITNPRAVFLFSDFTGNRATCETNLQTRTSGLAGAEYTVSAAVNDAFANGEFFRGRDYEVTFRLHVDSNVVTEATDRMYPEVLGRMRSCILKAPSACEAPFEAPTYFFYPWDSGSNDLTYGYYVQANDGDKIFDSVNMGNNVGAGIRTRTVASGTDWGSISTASVITNSDAQVRVSGLTKNSQVSVTFVENRYVASYNRGTTVTAFTRYFTGRSETPVATFSASSDDSAQRVTLDINFNNVDQLKSVVTIVGTFAKNGAGSERKANLTVTSVSGTHIYGYVPYADLDSEIQPDPSIPVSYPVTMTVNLTIYYDTGREGLYPLFETADSDYYLCCIREAGESGGGQYITPSGSGFLNKNQNSQDINALGSFFKMKKYPGAQGMNIASTLLNAPGKVAVQIYDMDETVFLYDTETNARAKLGGMYDATITGNQLGFTISHIDSNDRATATAGTNPEGLPVSYATPLSSATFSINNYTP